LGSLKFEKFGLWNSGPIGTIGQPANQLDTRAKTEWKGPNVGAQLFEKQILCFSMDFIHNTAGKWQLQWLIVGSIFKIQKLAEFPV
jgi:hypothetical protein